MHTPDTDLSPKLPTAFNQTIMVYITNALHVY